MSGPGHNGGPSMEPGHAWRRHAWTRARAELLPRLPLEVVRRRVRRAAELGIDYKAYAGIRAATGRDVVALLFSSNALRMLREARMDADRAAALASVRDAAILSLVQPPLDPGLVVALNPAILRAVRAPGLADSWGATRARVLSLTGPIPGDGVVVIGATALERGWSDAGRLAGYIDADSYFG